MSKSESSRRDFLKTSAVAAGGVLLSGTVHAAGSDEIRVGVIGCGGRGSGAAENVLSAARGVKVVAIGDYFQEKTDSLRNRLGRFIQEDRTAKDLGNSVDLPAERCFSGLDAYQKVINSDVNYIILATPPGFRPQHLQAAVAAGKHIFTEKPVSVDGPGTRKVLEVYEQARAKGLNIAAGTQRRHQLGYLETMKRIHDGAIGDIVAAQCYWNGGAIWFRPRKEGMTDVAYQLNNWYHFLWICGDHIVEQHVHNLDVVNWATGQHPVRAVAMGGRVRPCADPSVDGNIFNFFAVDFEYPKNVHVMSMCRQITGCDNNVSENLVGTKGTCQPNRYQINGETVLSRQQSRQAANPYVQEHTDLIEAIRTGKTLNELKNVAESTLTAILGRTAAYTGKPVTWEQALNSQLDTFPQDLSPSSKLEVPPVPVPGKTPLI